MLLLTAIQDQRAASCSQPLQEDFICHSTWKKTKIPPLHFFARGELSVRFHQSKTWISPPTIAKLEIISKMLFTSLSFRVPSVLQYQRTHTKLNFQLCWQCPSLFGGGNFLSIVAQKLFKGKFILNSQPSSYSLTLQFSRRKKNEASFKWIAPSRPRETSQRDGLRFGHNFFKKWHYERNVML